MPEGPSIVILKEHTQSFIGKKVIKAAGNSKKTNTQVFENKLLIDIKSWGKHFLLCFDDFTIKVHFLLFGTYRINQEKETPPRFSLQFDDGSKLNFYGCSILLLEGPLDEIYDWSADAMGVVWNPAEVYKRIRLHPKALICDVLLDQIFFRELEILSKTKSFFDVWCTPRVEWKKFPQRFSSTS